MKLSLQQAAVFGFGLLLGAVAAVWLLRAPHLSLGGSRLQLGSASLPGSGVPAPGIAAGQPVASAPKTAAATLPPPANCPSQAVTTPSGDKDSRFVLQANVDAKTVSDIPSFILAGKEAAAAGRSRDAEVAFLMACRVADGIKGSDSVESADARYQLGRHYTTLAQESGSAARSYRVELLRRAQMLYSDSLATYQVKYGAGHEKTRFAAEGLASALQVASGAAAAPNVAPAAPAPAPIPAPAVVAAAPVAVPKAAAPELRPPAAAAPGSALPEQQAERPAPARPEPPRQVAVAPAEPRPSAVTPAQPPRQAAVMPEPPRQIAPPAQPPRQVAVAPVPPPRQIFVPPPPPPRQVAAAPAAPVRIAPPRPVVPAPLPRRAEVAVVEAPLRQATGDASFPSPSFDCARARSRSEKIICSDAELARLDRDLGRLHARARSASPDPVAFRRHNDQEWRNRESVCRDRECLVQWYLHRREQLLSDIDQTSGRNQPTVYRWSR